MLYTNYLKIVIGPMFSSKSSFLVKEINRYRHITENIICINHLSDKKRTNIDAIRTHDHESNSSLMLSKLSELHENEEYIKADVVVIDEAQFFDDLYDFVERELKNFDGSKGKVFIVAGLSGDFNLKPIGQIFQLIPLANDIEKLSALCLKCKNGNFAHFTKRTEHNKRNETLTNVCVGGKEIYEPVCRFHYFN